MKLFFFVLAIGLVVSVYFFSNHGEKELDYRETYSRINDTRHYYFDQGVQREISTLAPNSDLEGLLEEMGMENDLHGYEKEHRSRTIVWHGYGGGGRLISHIDDCESGNGKCISRVTIVPSQRDRLLSLADGSRKRMFVEQAGWGDEWPFNVDYGIVSCERGSAVYFTTGENQKFPLNGLALSSGSGSNDLHEIWKNHPSPYTEKYSVGGLISEGLKICD